VIERVRLPRRLSRADPGQLPALLLARLALDRQLHGQGLGVELLLDALSRAVTASNQVGG
jgi:predicted N-acetyltransferase YhbS